MNNLNEKMVNDKNVRDENLEQLVEGMKNDALVRSDIWNLGEDSVFHTVFGEYMTVKQIAELFICTVKSIQKYCDKSQRPDQYDEIIEAGAKHYTYKELCELIENTKNHLAGGSENDDKNFKPNPKGQWLFSLRAVIKLGMFMTGTEKAKLFRDKIIDELALGQTAQETADEYFEAIFDKEHIRLYANNTEQLLVILDKSFKYDIQKGIIRKDVDPMKQKLRMINSRKVEFEKDIETYQNEINSYKAVNEDLYFEDICNLETKIEETKRVIQGLETVYKTLLLRLNVISKVVKKLSSESKSAAAYVSDLEVKVKEINKEYMSNTELSPQRLPAIKGAWDSKKMNSILMEIGFIESGIYAWTKETQPRALTGYIISKQWTDRYSKEFINSIQSTQDRTGNTSDKYIKWTPFGIRLISVVLELYYIDGWRGKDFIEPSEEDWEEEIYNRYIEEQKASIAKGK